MNTRSKENTDIIHMKAVRRNVLGMNVLGLSHGYSVCNEKKPTEELGKLCHRAHSPCQKKKKWNFWWNLGLTLCNSVLNPNRMWDGLQSSVGWCLLGTCHIPHRSLAQAPACAQGQQNILRGMTEWTHQTWELAFWLPVRPDYIFRHHISSVFLLWIQKLFRKVGIFTLISQMELQRVVVQVMCSGPHRNQWKSWERAPCTQSHLWKMLIADNLILCFQRQDWLSSSIPSLLQGYVWINFVVPQEILLLKMFFHRNTK